jgi:hypothetical protein
MRRYSTLQEVVNSVVVPSLGEFAGEHDVEAIARETHAHVIDRNAAGADLLNSAGFEQIVTEDAYWASVERNRRS